MSMIYLLREISDSKIETLLADPESIEETLSEDSENQVDLDKAWHGIHYLLTGDDWGGEEPLCFLLAGGETVGDIDVGYGPARVLNSTQAKAFAEALSKISLETFKSRFIPANLEEKDIYPSIWDEDDEAYSYLEHYFFSTLKPFIEEVSRNNNGVLCWMS